MRFVNQKTGEVLEVSPFELRLSRLEKRLSYFSSWVDHLQDIEGQEIDKIFIGLTYRPGVEWSSKHITGLLRKFKRLLGPKLFGYFWVAEMQERGAVHYHIILIVHKGLRLPKPDKSGLWTYGSTRIELVKFSVYSYLAKYLSKDEQKAGYPKGIRIFGCVVYVYKKQVAEYKLPMWLRVDIRDKFVQSVEVEDTDIFTSVLDYQSYKKVKGGWTNKVCFFESPYAVKDKFKTCRTAQVTP